ncbi:MAG: LytR C-terminal domain-containing protein [bacterium]
MPTKSIVAVFVKSKAIQAAKIVSGKITDPIEMEWSESLLPKAFVTIRDRYKTKKLSVVLDDDCDNLTERIKQITKDAGLELEVIELKSVSIARHVEPLIGITISDDSTPQTKDTLPTEEVALSEDISSKEDPPSDAESPATRPVFQTEAIDSPSGSLETPVAPKARKINKKLLLIIGGALVLILIIYGVIVLVGRQTSTTTSSEEPSPSPTEIIIATPTPEPSPASSAELAVFKLQILNGSGVPGEAGAVNTILESEGFDTAETDNAENYNYTDTIVQFKAGISDSVYTSIEMALSGKYTLRKGDELPDSSDYDIIVTVGTKLSAE